MKTRDDFPSIHHLKAELIDAGVSTSTLVDLNALEDPSCSPDSAAKLVLNRLYESAANAASAADRAQINYERAKGDYEAVCRVLDIEPGDPK